MTDWTKGFKIESDGTVAGTRVYDSEGKLVGFIKEFSVKLNADKVYPKISIIQARAGDFVVPGKTSSVVGSVTKVELNADNLNKCVYAKYRAYLLDDKMLEGVLETGVFNGDSVLNIYLDGFVSIRKERYTYVDGARKVPAMSDFTAHAARVGASFPGMQADWHDRHLDGSLHLAWFVDDKLIWVVKNLALCKSEGMQFADVFYLVNPSFLASGIIDLRVGAKAFPQTYVGGNTQLVPETEE